MPEGGSGRPSYANDKAFPQAVVALFDAEEGCALALPGALPHSCDVAAPKRSSTGSSEAEPMSRSRVLVVLLAAFAVGPASSASGASNTSSDSLARAATIRAEVDARYPGLRVTEASSTAVIDSVTLFTAEPDPRVVPAENGIYFAVCPMRATCPYPGRAARPPSAFAPRRVALELAVRTFLETEADLVLVSLPTPRFVILVFERRELEASQISEDLDNDPRRQASLDLRNVVDSNTLPRLFAPFGLEPCPNGRETLLARSLGSQAHA
jgi:hypothetical protein